MAILLDDEDVLIGRAIEAAEMKRKHVRFWSFFLDGCGAHGVEVGQEFVTELLDVINNDCINEESLQNHKDRPVHVIDCKKLCKYDAIGWLETVSKLPKFPTPILIIENITEIPKEDDVHDNQTYVENLLVHSWKNEINYFTDNRPNQNLKQFTLKPHDYLVFLTWTPDCAERINNVWKASDGLAWIGNLQEYKDKFISNEVSLGEK